MRGATRGTLRGSGNSSHLNNTVVQVLDNPTRKLPLEGPWAARMRKAADLRAGGAAVPWL